MTTIYLIRHGETEWNAEGLCQGTCDVPMNAAGYAQVEALAQRLAHIDFDAAYTSPLTRTRETARAILGARGLRAIAIPELVELSYGDLQGTHRDSWEPQLRDAWDVDPWSVTFPNGESLAMVHARAVPVFQQIVSAHAGETVLVSSHGHLNRVLALHALARPASDFWAIDQENASALILHFPLSSLEST
jgi:broad specificity phosphatase PhoE